MTSVTQEEYYAKIPKPVVYHPDLSGNDVRVYATLSERAGTKRKAWPGVRRIAKDLHMSTTTVQGALDKLESLQFIEVERMKGMVNRYHLPIPGVPDSDTPPYQKLTHTVSDSDTELDQRTKPKELKQQQFENFNLDRARTEAKTQKTNGTRVRTVEGLALSIADRDDFRAESEHFWAHLECEACGGLGFTEVYAPGSGLRQVACGV